MSATDRLLERLEGVHQVALSRWCARCPAHDDKRPSLSIRETSDGTILLHDFAGCSAAEILAAIGMELRDLFPGVQAERRPERPSHWHAAKIALRVLHDEVLIVLLASEDLVAGRPLGDVDRERLMVAVERIRGAADACT